MTSSTRQVRQYLACASNVISVLVWALWKAMSLDISDSPTIMKLCAHKYARPPTIQQRSGLNSLGKGRDPLLEGSLVCSKA